MCGLLLTLLLQQSNEAENLIRQLGDDDPDVRQAAQAALVTLGTPAVERLKRARDDPDPERKARVREILLRVELDPMIRDLGSPDRTRWQPAARALVDSGSQAIALLRSVAGDELTAFRAKQVADILETQSVDGLRFGVVVESPQQRLNGEVSGIEIFTNSSIRDVVIETAVDAKVSTPGICGWKGWATSHPVRRECRVTLGPGATHTKGRADLLMPSNGDGSGSGPYIETPGVWELSFRYVFQGKGAWKGMLEGNRVPVRLTK